MWLIILVICVTVVVGEECIVYAPYEHWCSMPNVSTTSHSQQPYKLEIDNAYLGHVANISFLDNHTMFLFRPNNIGIGTVDLYWDNYTRNSVIVKVMWRGDISQIIFQYLMITSVIALIFCIGCEIDLDLIWNYIKRPYLPLVGLGCQYVIMPMVAMIIYLVTSLTTELGLGLFTLASSPGGFGSNMWCIILGGDLNLSSAMTFFSTVASPAMMVMWLTIFQQLYLKKSIRIPYLMICIQLLEVVIPLILGALFVKWCPRVKAAIMKCGRIIIIIFLVNIITFGTYVNFHIYRLLEIYPRGLFVGAMLSWVSFALSYTICTLVLKFNHKLSLTVALETSIQNIGIALVILRYSMPQPQGDIASMIPILSGFTVLIPLLVYWLILFVMKKCETDKPETFEPSIDWQEQYNNPIFEENTGYELKEPVSTSTKT